GGDDMLNPKSEYRNPKRTRNSNAPNALCFEFRILSLFRISNFVLRVSVGSHCCRARSPRRHTAVDADGLAGDKRGFFAGEVSNGVGNVLRHAPAAGRNQLEVGILLRLRVLLMALDG